MFQFNEVLTRRIWGARVDIFVLGRHLGFSNSGGLGRGDIRRNPATGQTSTGRASSYNPGGIEAIYLAFRIPLRNNACTAG